MGKVKILVVEDDLLHFAKMEMILSELGYQLSGHALSAEDALRLFRATHPDLILMDIQIIGATDGIELAGRLDKMADVPIIFTTSFTDEYTLRKAIEIEPHAYLTKPLEKNDLKAAIELAIHKHKQKTDLPVANQSVSRPWLAETAQDQSFFVKLVDRIEKIKFSDVLFIESADEAKYLNIQTKNEVYKMRSSLKQLMDKLPLGFVRANSSQVINALNIDSISDASHVVNMAGYRLVMSRKYKKEIMEKLNFLN